MSRAPYADLPDLDRWLRKLFLFLRAHQDSGVILSLESDLGNRVGQRGLRDAPDMASALRPVVGRLLRAYPDLIVLTDPTAAYQAPAGSVVLLCLREDELTKDGRWLDLQRTMFVNRALRVVLWCEGLIGTRLHEAAPHFASFLSHRLRLPAALLRQPAHAVAGLRALVRARAPGAFFSSEWKAGVALQDLIHEALPRWGYQQIPVGAYEDLLRAIKSGEGGRQRMLWFLAESAFALRRTLWALAESGWRRPCMIYDAGHDSPGFWRLHPRYMPLHEAARLLSRAPRPGLLAALLGQEPEAVELCAALLDRGADADDLTEEVAGAEDPGAAIALRCAAAGLVDWGDVASGQARPPLLRALWDRPEARALRVSGRRAPRRLVDPDAALRCGDVTVALRWTLNDAAADADRRRRVMQVARALVAQQARRFAETPRLRRAMTIHVLHASADAGQAEELALLLALLEGVAGVILSAEEEEASFVLPLISADLLVCEGAIDAIGRARAARRPIHAVLLRACDWEAEPALAGLPIWPAFRAVNSWASQNEAWDELLRRVQTEAILDQSGVVSLPKPALP